MDKKKEVSWKIVVITIAGMMCLTGAEIYALSQGINGTIFSIYVAIIAGAIGVSIPNPFKPN